MNLAQPLLRWFQPRNADADLKFRERTIRVLVVVLLFLVVAAFLTSLLVFGAEWEPVSYLTAEVLAGVMLVFSGLAIARGRITTAGYLLVATFMVFSVFILMVPRSESAVGITASFMTLVVVALVLPRNSLIWNTFVIIGFVALIAFYQEQYQHIGLEFVLNNSIVLTAIAALLFVLRTEFDNRLRATEAARRETEQALSATQLARNEAERANRAKDQFLSIMSHELRTPLGAIIGFIGILQLGMIKDKKEALPLSATQQRMLKDSRANAEHLLTLINSILDLAKVSSGRIVPNLTAVNPQDENFIAGTVLALRSLAIGKGIELNLEMSPDLPATVTCDQMQIKQVVKNLVGNAIKFTETGHVNVRIMNGTPNQWRVLVQDTGIGIKPSQVSNIFDPFYQADNSDSRSREGTGLGLAIAKRYVELHQGDIQVQSDLDKGTTFTVVLPTAPVPATAATV